MKKYTLQSIDNDNGVVYLKLVPRKAGDGFRFIPGQYATIGFRGENGRLSPMRCFSITSPNDSEILEFATRIGGNFTNALSKLSIGDEMYVQGPFGDFTVNSRRDRNIVMIAGGIGITPFMSMIRTATNLKLDLPMTLLYSSRKNEGIAFHDELREKETINPNLRVAMFATDQTNPPEIPRMLSGRMTEKHIDQVVGGKYANSTYFICGPKGFTENTVRMLSEKGVNEDSIFTESFTQSSKVSLGGYNLRRLTYSFASALLIAGIFSIAFLDLSRYLPRHTVAANSANSTQLETAGSGITSSDSSSTDQSTNSTSASPSSTSSSSDTSPNNSSSNTSASSSNKSSSYQQPVTSVS